MLGEELTTDAMMKHYHRLLKIQDGVYQSKVNGLYYIKWQKCQQCGQPISRLEARQCGNGFWSWKCQPCWNTQK